MARDQAMADSGKCGAVRKGKQPCGRPAGWGTQHKGVGCCKLHGGSTPTQELHGQIVLARREMSVMGAALSIEPHEAILECIRIAAGEVAYCSERIADLSVDDAIVQSTQTHDRPIRRDGGADHQTKRTTETRISEPQLHVWILARRQAMDRLVTYSATALKAGVEERRVRVAEQVGTQLAEAFRQFAQRMGMDPSAPKVREAMRDSLTVIQGGRVA